MSTSSYTQLASSPRRSTSLWGKQICMSGSDMTYGQFTITSEDKFQDQWTLIQLTQTKKSTINDDNIKTKTTKANTFKCSVWMKLIQISNLLKEAFTFYILTIITVKW